MTGQCDGGCDAGWAEYLCKKGDFSNTKVHIAYKKPTKCKIVVSIITYTRSFKCNIRLHLHEKFYIASNCVITGAIGK